MISHDSNDDLRAPVGLLNGAEAESRISSKCSRSDDEDLDTSIPTVDVHPPAATDVATKHLAVAASGAEQRTAANLEEGATHKELLNATVAERNVELGVAADMFWDSVTSRAQVLSVPTSFKTSKQKPFRQF